MRSRLVGLALLCGCTPRTDIALPMLDDARTLIVTASSESLTSVFVAEPGGASEVVEYLHRGGEHLTLELSSLPETVEALDLTLGLQAADHPASQSYPLPFSLVRLQARFSEDHTSGGWDSVVVAAPQDEKFGLVPASLACLAAGGCLVPGGAGDCSNPCPVAAPDPPAEPEPPAPAAGVELRPCPRGWTEVPTEEVGIRCVPWTAPTDQPCPDGQVRLPGNSNCAPLLGPCGPDRFHPDLPPGTRIYVDAAAAAPGDGSFAAPYADLQDAVAMAEDGAVLALARGEYQGGVEIARSMSVVGACPAEVRINAPAGAPALTLSGAVDLYGLTLIGGALMVGPNARGTVRGVEVRDAPELGLSLEGGELSLEEVSITRSASVAVFVQGGRLSADRLLIHQVTRRGLLARQASQLWLSRTVVQDVELTAAGIRGDGIALAGATTATLAETVIEGTHTVALSVSDAGTHLTARDLWIDSVRPDSQDRFGDGLGVVGAASASIGRVQVSRTHRHALVGFDQSRVALEDVWVSDSTDLGSGVAVFQEATVNVARAHVSGQAVGLRVTDAGELRVSDFEVRGLVPGGLGLGVTQSAQLFLSRGSVHDFPGVGLLAAHFGRLEAKDLEVFEISAPSLAPEGGIGLDASGGSRVSLERIRVGEVGLVGLMLRSADTEASDLEVNSRLGTALVVGGAARLNRSRSRSSFGVLVESGELTAHDFSSQVRDRGSCTAAALSVSVSSTATLVRAQVEEAYGAGIRVEGVLLAEHLQVRNIQPYVDECVRDSLLSPGTYGAALDARALASVGLEDFVLESSPIGASIDPLAGLSLERGVLRGTSVGLIAPKRLIPTLGSGFRFDQVPELVRLRAVAP